MATKPALPAWRGVTDGPTNKALTQVRTAISGVLAQSHVFGVFATVTFPAANTSVRVPTSLSGDIKGYRVEKCSVAMQIFDGAPPAGMVNVKGVAWLQSTAAGTATVYLY